MVMEMQDAKCWVCMIYINNKWKEFSAVTHLWSKLHHGSVCRGNKRAAAVLREVHLLFDFLAATFKKKYNEIIANR